MCLPLLVVDTRDGYGAADLYPTLLEAAGLPPNPTNEGRSLMQLLKAPASPEAEAQFNVS